VEEALGQVLAAAPHLRDRMVLATKGGITPGVPYDSRPATLRASCEGSIRRLGVDAVDLWMVHRPDPFTHPAEVAAVLTGLVEDGLTRAVGVSNHTPAQVETLQAHLSLPLVTNQVEFSAVHLDPLRDGTFDQCLRLGMVPMAWGPLRGGALVRPPGPGHPGGVVRPQLLEVLDWLARREGVDRAAAALAFVLAHPARPVAVVGTTRPERIGEMAQALGVRLTRSDVYDVIEASQGESLP
jgi:predicted oxidoreductase